MIWLQCPPSVFAEDRCLPRSAFHWFSTSSVKWLPSPSFSLQWWSHVMSMWLESSPSEKALLLLESAKTLFKKATNHLFSLVRYWPDSFYIKLLICSFLQTGPKITVNKTKAFWGVA